MKVTIERAALLKAMSRAQGVVERKNTIPTLANVLIEAGGERGSDRVGLRISIATMLVNTNDAFTSLNTAVDTMAVGDVLTFNSVAYDAGTEADTEMATNIPGPAGGGTGFDAARNDQADRVVMHSGIVSQDDGLTTSDLTEQHRFDNPVARISIERIN